MTSERRSGLPVPGEQAGALSRDEARYTDEDAAEILARASRHEVRSQLPTAHDATLADLVAAAEDVGMDGAAVRRAAQVRPLAESRTQELLFGGQATRTVRGTGNQPLPSDRSRLAQVAETVTGRAGEVVRSDPGSWIWESKAGLGHTRMVLKETGGTTQLTAQSGKAGALGMIYGSLFVATAAASGAMGLFASVSATAGPLAALVALLGVPMILTRALFPRWDRGTRDHLEHLVMELIRVVESDDSDVDTATTG
jgi:hypothetical protein